MSKDLALIPISAALIGLVGACAFAQTMESLEAEMTAMIDRVSESIVSVNAVADVGGKLVSRSVGCGVVFDRDGLVLTTTSVVGHAKQVEVMSASGAKHRGRVVGIDPASDIAVVKVENVRLAPAAFSERRTLRPGSWIFVLGNAFGSLPSVSMGVVSGLSSPLRDDMGEEMLRISVALNPGDTGAPVVDARGEVVGIAVGRISFNPWSASGYVPEGGPQGMGFLQPSGMSVAVPAERALAIAKDIARTGGKERGFLGVRVVELSDDMRSHVGDPTLDGVVVTEVVASSPADSVGIAPGDVITGFAARQIKSVSSLLETVGVTKPGDVVTITYVRNSKRLTSDIRVSPFLSEYLHRQPASLRTSPEDVDVRIDNIKSEIERLKADLKNLESRR